MSFSKLTLTDVENSPEVIESVEVYSRSAIAERAAKACYGSGLHTTRDDKEKADALMQGIYLYRKMYEVKVDFENASFEIPDDFPKSSMSSLLFTFHSFRWLDPLRRQYIASGEKKYLDALEAFVFSWTSKNGTPPTNNMPTLEEPRDYTWYDMSAAWRTTALACLLPETTRQDDLVSLLEVHQEALKLESYYAGNGNHALHHNNALMVSSYILGDQSGMDLAHERTARLTETQLDLEGVSLEGAPLYQGLNMDWWMETLELYRRLELDVPNAERVHRMTDFLLYTIDYEQQFMLFGDSARKEFKFPEYARDLYSPAMYERLLGDAVAQNLFNEDAFDAPTLPKTRMFSEGWGFSRKTWFPQNECDHSTLAIKAGGSIDDRVHSHEDHGSFIFNTKHSRLFDDSGMYAYYGGDRRMYVRSNDAHNSVVLETAKYYASADGDLRLLSSNANVDLFEADIRTTQNTVWNRQVAHVKDSHSLIVTDIVTSALDTPIKQHFHLGDTYSARLLSDTRVLAIEMDTGNKYLIEFLLPGKAAVATGQVDPMLGWRSSFEGEVHPVDTIVFTLSDRLKAKSTVVITPVGKDWRETAVSFSRFSTKDTRLTYRADDGVVDITFGKTGVTAYAYSRQSCTNPAD